MSEATGRYAAGGFEPRFVVSRTDGSACRPHDRFFVLNVGVGVDPHAALALRVYAASVRAENPKLADDIIGLIGPRGGMPDGGFWPPELAQHKDSK